jgi:hypothetical protein
MEDIEESLGQDDDFDLSQSNMSHSYVLGDRTLANRRLSEAKGSSGLP